MADIPVRVIIEAQDKASDSVKGFGSRLDDLGSKMRQVGAAGAALGAATALVTKSLIEQAGAFEQNTVAFEVMLGSAQKATVLLDQIKEFAKKTPFQLEELVEGSKRLLAYNVEAKDLIPTLGMLGDITSGVGREKLPQLILAFGQVKAATKLTGAELRQFSEAGVPLLDALVKQANAAGGQWVTTGGQAKKASVDVAELNDKLAIARQRLTEASASGKAKESTLMSLRNTIQNYEQKLAGANETGKAASRVWVENKVTAADMIQKISDGEVTFDMVQKALTGMTEKGGKFHDLMQKQSQTTLGKLSNLQDSIQQLQIKMGQALLPTANKLMDAITPIIISFGDWAAENPALTQTLVAVGLAIGAVGTALLALGLIIPPITAAIGLFGGISLVTFGWIAAAVVAAGIAIFVFAKAFNDNLDWITGKLQPFVDKFKYVVERIKQEFAKLGISGEFGGLINFFQGTAEKMDFWTKRILQIGTEWKNKMQNILAFGSDAPGMDASWVDALEGVWNRVQVLIENMSPLFEHIGAQLAVSGEIIKTQLVPAWDALMEVMKPFIEAVGPIFLEFLKNIAISIGIIVAGILTLAAAILTGIVTAIANALPFILQALEGVIQFIRGFVQFVTGIITLDLGLVLEGMKQMFFGAAEFIINTLAALLKAITGFVRGVIGFFQGLYDTLVGHSIIPDMVNAIIMWFQKMVDDTLGIVFMLPGIVAAAFEDAKQSAIQKAMEMYEGVKGWFDKIIGFFKDIVNWANQAISKAREAFSINTSPKRQFGGPVSSATPVIVGEAGPEMFVPQTAGNIIPNNQMGKGGGSGTTIQFIINTSMIINSPTERRNLAEALYKDLATLARSQNMTVAELMGA